MFAPIVVLVRRIVGNVRFTKARGQAISLHSKVITNFCNRFGITSSKRQNMIRLARDNGKRLGFLA
jgi:hypothetical protein